jgi:DNA-binding NarL/FixJ family response regulator
MNMYMVYVVEDSLAIRDAIISHLESLGQIEVIGAADSACDAWNDTRLPSAHAIIVDLALRHSNGFDLLQKLNAAPQFANVVKIVLTNYTTKMFRQRALALGASHFFDKSFDFEQVAELLENLARRHNAHTGGLLGSPEAT